MSKNIITIRRKSDGKILTDVINDSCQVHNIYDLKNSEFSKDDYINGRYDDKLIISDKDFNIGYEEGVGFYDWTDFEVVKDENKVFYAPYVPVTNCFIFNNVKVWDHRWYINIFCRINWFFHFKLRKRYKKWANIKVPSSYYHEIKF